MIGFFSPSMPEMMVVGMVALLLFGKRLPEVARSLGKGVKEFKSGLAGFTDEFNDASSSTSSRSSHTTTSRPLPPDDDLIETTAPKFQPPPAAPVETSQTV